MRIGSRAAVDVGTKRIGLACCDREVILATPLATVDRGDILETVISDVVALIPESVIEIYVGLPVNLQGNSSQSTLDAVLFAQVLQTAVTCPVRLIDERMTTALANSQLRQIGKSQKDARSSIDQMAAVAILEYALELEKKQGIEPGISLSDWKLANE